MATRGQLGTALGLNSGGTGELRKVSEQGSDQVEVWCRRISLAARAKGTE